MHRSLNDTIVKNLLTFSTHHNYYNVIILSILYYSIFLELKNCTIVK